MKCARTSYNSCMGTLFVDWAHTLLRTASSLQACLLSWKIHFLLLRCWCFPWICVLVLCPMKLLGVLKLPAFFLHFHMSFLLPRQLSVSVHLRNRFYRLFRRACQKVSCILWSTDAVIRKRHAKHHLSMVSAAKGQHKAWNSTTFVSIQDTRCVGIGLLGELSQVSIMLATAASCAYTTQFWFTGILFWEIYYWPLHCQLLKLSSFQAIVGQPSFQWNYCYVWTDMPERFEWLDSSKALEILGLFFI